MKTAAKPLIAIAVLLAALAAGGVYVISRDEGPPEDSLRQPAAAAAGEWIRNHSPTFVYDGTDLELRGIEKRETGKGDTGKVEPARYDIVFEFESRHAGYGNRQGKMLAQVITPHTIEVRVERNPETGGWDITRAVTDGVFDEKTGKFLEGAARGKKEKTRKIDLYFMRVEDGQEEPAPIPREIRNDNGVERQALGALLEGPTREEKAQGYFSSIPEGVEIEELELTLTQFEHIDKVEIAVEGRTEGILQP